MQAVADCRSTQGGTLRLGLVSSVSELAARQWIAPFSRSHPGVAFELYEANTYQLLEQLRSRQFDLALVRTPFLSRPFRCQVLPPRPMLAIWHPERSSPAAAGVIAWRRWRGSRWCCTGGGSRSWRRPSSAGACRPRSGSGGTAPGPAWCWPRRAWAIALAPESMEEPARDWGLEACPVDEPALSSGIALVQNENGCDTAAGRAFWDYFQAIGRKAENSPGFFRQNRV